MPGIGGTTGREPVAMTKRRARMANPPACTSSGEVKRAQARITRTPSPSNRSWLSMGAMVSMVRATWSLTAAEVDLGDDRRDPEARPCRHRMRRLGRRQQRLRRHAAMVQAVAPHLGPFDQHHARAHLRRTCRDRQPARSCADHADIRLDPLHLRYPSRRRARITMGSAASAQRPRIGPRICGSNRSPRFGVSPRSNTSPRPAPTQV